MKKCKIKAKMTRYEDVTIDAQERLELAINLICEACNLPMLAPGTRAGWFIRDGNLIEWFEEHGGPHSWDEEQVIRDATPLDHAASEVIKRLREYAGE